MIRFYTKFERHKIYKLALEIYKYSFYKYYFKHGLCRSINEAATTLYGSFHETDSVYFHMNLYFPEIYQFKPEKLFSDFYWFDPNDGAKRIEILEKAIELTK